MRSAPTVLRPLPLGSLHPMRSSTWWSRNRYTVAKVCVLAAGVASLYAAAFWPVW